MKTPNLDREINRLKWMKIQGDLSPIGENTLIEFASIKKALSKANVVGQSEQYHCELYDFSRKDYPCDKQCDSCKAMNLD